MNEGDQQLAEQVRMACVRAALEAYQDAGVSGLCAEGRWEYTIGVLRRMDLGPLLSAWLADTASAGCERSTPGG